MRGWRYWDGATWTEHSEARNQAIATGPPPPVKPAPLPAVVEPQMPAAEPATSRFGRMLGKRSDSERAGEERYERLLSEMVAGRVDLAGLPA